MLPKESHMSAVDPPLAAAQGFERPCDLPFEIRSSVRLHAVFREFLRAFEYAQDLRTNIWDFAVELSWLRRLKVTNSDLRWLVGARLVDHAIETTSSGDADRSFKSSSRLLFTKRTCFVLTSKGAVLSRSLWGADEERIERRPAPFRPDPTLLSIAPSPECVTPKWDRDRQELRVGARVVKRFRVPAASQEAILAAFEEESWPPRIDDPLPPRSDQSPKRRLQETIKSLNRNQRHSLIRFSGDGNAQGVLWELIDAHDWRTSS
jgi:hypothetical protein